MTERRVVTAPRSVKDMPPKRATIVAHRIVRAIHNEQLKVGDRLPLERDLMLQYNVGRNTVREALRLLELQGVLTIRTGRGGGPAVAAPDSRHLARIQAV